MELKSIWLQSLGVKQLSYSGSYSSLKIHFISNQYNSIRLNLQTLLAVGGLNI